MRDQREAGGAQQVVGNAEGQLGVLARGGHHLGGEPPSR
jgi:hypothetical protein